MCSLAAPRAADPGFGAATFLDRQRGVTATMAPAASSGHTARKRGRRDDGSEHVVVDPAASSSSAALQIRMDKELVALQDLVKKAKLLLPRSAAPAEKKNAPAPRPPEAPSSAAKRTTSQSKAATATVAASYHQIQMAQAANLKHQQRAEANKQNPTAPVPNKQPAEAPVAAKQSKKRRPEEEKELARAAAREEFRQMLLEMEKAALPDETVYPEELEALGIPFDFVVTRTWKQACLEDGVGATVAVV